MIDREDIEDNWVKGSAEFENENILWKQYEVYVDIFKFYLDTTWKVITWFYAITGAILVYYFDHVDDNNSYLKFALVLPGFFSFGFYKIFGYGTEKAQDLSKWLEYIRSQLNLPGKPHTDILTIFLRNSKYLFLLVTIGILFLFIESFF